MSSKTRYLYPLKLSPVLKQAIWGGRRLIKEYGKDFDGESLAEAWELSSRTKNDSAAIANGDLAGTLLCDYFKEFGEALIGKKHAGGAFPLLVKWIDARDKLSVQVHPDDAYAKAHEDSLGKTELWYIAEAKEGARLVYGLADGADKGTLVAALESGEVERVLKTIPVKAGDAVFIPAGMLHAIGEGIVIAEIQQSSDVTYRFYDYDRRDKNGNPRPLHVEKAMAVVRSFSEEEINAVRYAHATEEERRSPAVLAVCPYFRVELVGLDGERTLEVTEDSFLHLLCTEGEGRLVFDGEEYSFSKGESYLLPAALGKCTFLGCASLLISKI